MDEHQTFLGDLLFHGSFESLSSSSRTIDWDPLFIHTRDLAQRALCCAEDEATGLGHINFNLCSRSNIFFFSFTVSYSGSRDCCSN